MPERPLLILPSPGDPVTRRQRHGGGGKFHRPTPERQSERLSPQFERLQLQQTLEERRARLHGRRCSTVWGRFKGHLGGFHPTAGGLRVVPGHTIPGYAGVPPAQEGRSARENEHAGGTPAYPGAFAVGEKPHGAHASDQRHVRCS